MMHRKNLEKKNVKTFKSHLRQRNININSISSSGAKHLSSKDWEVTFFLQRAEKNMPKVGTGSSSLLSNFFLVLTREVSFRFY